MALLTGPWQPMSLQEKQGPRGTFGRIREEQKPFHVDTPWDCSRCRSLRRGFRNDTVSGEEQTSYLRKSSSQTNTEWKIEETIKASNTGEQRIPMKRTEKSKALSVTGWRKRLQFLRNMTKADGEPKSSRNYILDHSSTFRR